MARQRSQAGAAVRKHATESTGRGLSVKSGAFGAEKVSVATPETRRGAGRTWLLWFPVRPGPPRKVKRRVAGVEIVQRVTRLELPPTKNNHAKDPHSHADWVKCWRANAWALAKEARIPSLGRIRISAVVYRERLGIADAENDHSRLAPLQDGLVDAKVIPKDTYRYCERGEVAEARADERGPGILLVIEELPAEGQQARGEA